MNQSFTSQQVIELLEQMSSNNQTKIVQLKEDLRYNSERHQQTVGKNTTRIRLLEQFLKEKHPTIYKKYKEDTGTQYDIQPSLVAKALGLKDYIW